MDKFTTGYLECLLWQATDGSDSGTPLEDLGFDVGSFSDDALKSIEEDCADFQESNASDLTLYEESRDMEHAGHDFCLTRNGHGAGFWDRGLGALGDRLSDMARPYGSTDVYVGDDDELHVS